MLYSRLLCRAAVARAAARERTERLQGSQLARHIADALAELQAEAVVVLDISRVAGFTDYFVIATAKSPRQFEALAHVVEREVPAETGAAKPRREGKSDSGWQLFDYGDVVVHLLTPEQRHYYGLEQLWSGGTPLLRDRIGALLRCRRMRRNHS